MFLLLSIFCFDAINGEIGKVYDLSHSFDEKTVHWPSMRDYSFNLTNLLRSGNASTPMYVEYGAFCGAEHGGTHIDAPIHISFGKKTVTDIPVEDLIGPGFVVNVEQEAKHDRNLLISVEHLQRAEKSQGRIPDRAILLLNTGWSKKAHNWTDYFGTASTNTSLLTFPGLHPDAATWLVKNRKVNAVGIDTASIDYGKSSTYRAHRVLFKENIPALENVKDIHRIINKSTTVFVLPMKITKGSGAPARIIAVENFNTSSGGVMARASVSSMLLVALFLACLL